MMSAGASGVRGSVEEVTYAMIGLSDRLHKLDLLCLGAFDQAYG
jgi:hypothetical protein